MSKIAIGKGVGKNRGTYNRFFPYKALIYADRIERIVADEFWVPVTRQFISASPHPASRGN